MESETKVKSCAHFLSETKHLVEKPLFTNNTFFVEPVRQQAQHCTVAISILQHSNIDSYTQNPPLCWNSGSLRVP